VQSKWTQVKVFSKKKQELDLSGFCGVFLLKSLVEVSRFQVKMLLSISCMILH